MLEPDMPVAKPNPMRMLGHFELRQLLGKSVHSMTWLALDTRSHKELMLTMPRAQPARKEELLRWQGDANQAARLGHPNLAPAFEIGVLEHWPYVAADRVLGQTLAERLSVRWGSPAESVDWLIQLLEGLAFAHQAGVAHGDLQLHQVLIDESGIVRVMALAASGHLPQLGSGSSDGQGLQVARAAAQRDVLSAGILMHHLLAGQPALNEPDVSQVIDRMMAQAPESIRIPWTLPQPIGEGLRAIANRATERQERQRYHNVRTLLNALNGWRESSATDVGGPLLLLLDRVRTIGHLPASPGVGARVARVAMAEGERMDEISHQMLQDIGLCLELIRNVNSALVRGTQVAGSGPVLSLRRAVALLGLKGLRQAAASLRAWPGPLSEEHAAEMQILMDRVRLTGHVAQVMSPAGYDPEVIYLITLLQNLGRLLVQYHFPDDAEQIRQLMKTLPPLQQGGPEQNGMSEDAASFAVLGIDVKSLGNALAKSWGMSDEVLHLIQRLPIERPVRQADDDGEVLRQVSSAANELVDLVSQLPAPRVSAAISGLSQRYVRVLQMSPPDIVEALQRARSVMRGGLQASIEGPRAVHGEAPGPELAHLAPTAPSEFAKALASRHPR